MRLSAKTTVHPANRSFADFLLSQAHHRPGCGQQGVLPTDPVEVFLQIGIERNPFANRIFLLIQFLKGTGGIGLDLFF